MLEICGQGPGRDYLFIYTHFLKPPRDGFALCGYMYEIVSATETKGMKKTREAKLVRIFG